MGRIGPDFASVDEHLAANVRLRRETAGMSQEELAERMTERGFGFSQATVWKIEQGKRSVKLQEAIALADALGIISWEHLLADPEQGSHAARLEARHKATAAAFGAVEEATKAYLWEQAKLVNALYEAEKAGVDVLLLWTSYLDEPPERAVIGARIAWLREDEQRMDIVVETEKVVAALRANGYQPFWSTADVEEVGPALPAAANAEEPPAPTG